MIRFNFVCLFLLFPSISTSAGRTKSCPNFDAPENGFFFTGFCKRTPGSFCGLGCLTGYRLIDGDSFRECLANGTWTGRIPICQKISCPSLKLNSRVIHQCSSPLFEKNQFDVGTECEAKCNQTGYRLVGPRIRKCLPFGKWTGYDQSCVVGEETTLSALIVQSTSTRPTTTTPKYLDYSNYALTIENNTTGLIFDGFDSTHFAIIFWFYLETNTNTRLISLTKNNSATRFDLSVQTGRLTVQQTLTNRTKLKNTTSINIPSRHWTHLAWTYSLENRQSYFYLDGTRQSSIDFGAMSLDFENATRLILFDAPFDGSITRIELWKQLIAEQPLLVSFRDCRKQNGDFFSWSQVPDEIQIDTSKLRSSSFCSGCSEPASIPGGIYRVSDYEVGESVEYECNYGYEMIGASRAFCMVPSEWYPLPPTCKYKPCTSECELCEQKTGVCLRQHIKIDPLICDPPCDDDEVCIDGECSWTNIVPPRKHDPPATVQSHCPMTCRSDQVCVDGRCGCYKGLCENGRPCYEVCEMGERCLNFSCSCGFRGKCGQGEICQLDLCMCGSQRGGCRPHEICLNGQCRCKTSSCDRCNNACKSNEMCLDGKCVCVQQCEKAFCPLPCLNGGRCTGFYQCTCRQGWQGHRCEKQQVE